MGAWSVVSDLSTLISRRLLPALQTNGLGGGLANLSQKIAEGVGGAGSSMVGELSLMGELRELIDLQIQVQKEMQTVSMVSNIEKSKHESRMAPIRNIRTN